jgi:hypothetical protein
MSGYDADVGGRHGRQEASGLVPATEVGHFARNGASRRPRGAFDPDATVVDPQVPQAARDELERGWPGHGTALALVELVRFRDPRPDVPAPPRSLATARKLAAAAGALVALSIVAGVFGGPATFAVFFVIGLAAGALAAVAWAAAEEGRPALAAGLIPLAPASDLTEYHAAHAGRIFHRRYVRPRTDLDQGARATWERAIVAANRIYRSDSLRDKVVDADRVAADVPELLWKIAEGLAMSSDVRIDIRNIVRCDERHHPAVAAKLREQERQVARGTGQVDRRIGRLEMLANRLDAADGARRGEAVLKRLLEVDTKIHDLVASTDESASHIDMAEGMKIDVEAIIEMTDQAIRELSARDEDPGDIHADVS